jgi:diketogulonate reductase-like aldo/keto reductase
LLVKLNDLFVPALLYGTAWKENVTKECVLNALECGFRGFDSANQRKNCDERSVGEALNQAIKSGTVKRDALFLQTKFTHARDQDGHLPYEENAELFMQMKQSLEGSLQNLQTDYIDSFLLHSMSDSKDLSAEDIEAWEAMELIFKQGKVKALGVCNIGIEKLRALWDKAFTKPQFIQNRCYARKGWDRDIREFCKEKQMAYQGYSLLNANSEIFKHSRFKDIVKRYDCTEAQVVFRFSLQAGIIALTGTRDPQHMSDDLAVFKLELSPHDMRLIEYI